MIALPQSWVNCALSELLKSLESGSRPKGGVKGILEGIPSLGGEHLTWDGKFDFSSIRYVPKQFALSMNKGHIKTNDILIVKDGATTGKTSFVDHSFPYPEAVVNEHVFICRPVELIDARYLFRFLMSEEGKQRILNNFQGSAQGGINLSFAPNTEIPLAPLNEQRRIVAKLDELLSKVDACKARLDKIPAILKRFRQSVLAAACSGRLTADWREQNWEAKSVRELLPKDSIKPKTNELAEIPEKWCYSYITPFLSTTRRGMKTGPFGSMLKKQEHQPNGIPVLGIENIASMRFVLGSKIHISLSKAKELSEYSAEPGDILISRSGTVGEVCVVPEGLGEARISTNVLRVSLASIAIHPFFFCILFNGSPVVIDQISELCKGSTREFLNQRILSSIIFPIPPLLEQQEIVRQVEMLFKIADQIEKRYQKARVNVNKLTQSILAKAFRGELAPQDPNDEPATKLLERIRTERAKPK